MMITGETLPGLDVNQSYVSRTFAGMASMPKMFDTEP